MRGYPPGTVRTWGGQQYQKQGDGDWREVPEGTRQGGARPAQTSLFDLPEQPAKQPERRDETIAGVRYQLVPVVGDKRGVARVLVHDADTGDLVGATTYPTVEQAASAYTALLDKVRQGEGQPPTSARHPGASPPAPKPGEVRYPPPDLAMDRMLSSDKERAASVSSYFDAGGQRVASSRTTPAGGHADHPVGSWKVDSRKGLHGHEIEQLVEFNPGELGIGEHMVEHNEEGRRDDAERYAGWLREGKRPPPIHVIQTEKGNFRVTDGHRRLAAAQMAGKPVRAWVSYTVPVPGEENEKHGIKTGLTYELAQQHHAAQQGTTMKKSAGFFDDLVKAEGADPLPAEPAPARRPKAPAASPAPPPTADELRKSEAAAGRQWVKGPAGTVLVDTSLDGRIARSIEAGETSLTRRQGGAALPLSGPRSVVRG